MKATLGLVAVSCLLLASPAAAQEIESIFMPGQNAEGYYVANSGVGKLRVSLLADSRDVRPIAFRARVIVEKKFFGEQKVNFDTTAQLALKGRQGSEGLDQWYLPAFTWSIGCTEDGHTVSINGKEAGTSPVDFIIEVGVLRFLEAGDESMQLIKDSLAESRKKRILCGEYTPLPIK